MIVKHYRVDARGTVYDWYSTPEMKDEILNLINFWWLCQDAIGSKKNKTIKS